MIDTTNLPDLDQPSEPRKICGVDIVELFSKSVLSLWREPAVLTVRLGSWRLVAAATAMEIPGVTIAQTPFRKAKWRERTRAPTSPLVRIRPLSQDAEAKVTQPLKPSRAQGPATRSELEQSFLMVGLFRSPKNFIRL